MLAGDGKGSSFVRARGYKSRVRFLRWLLVVVLAGVSCTHVPSVGGSGAVTAGSVGPVALGMALAEARAAVEGASYVWKEPENKRLEESGAVILWIGHEVFSVVDAAGREVLNLLSAAPGRHDALDEKVVMITATGAGFATREGVGPGMRIDRAAAIYGAPQLADDDLSGFRREWVVFPGAPQGMRFVAAGPDGRLAGVYADGQMRTMEFREGSTIRAVVVGASR